MLNTLRSALPDRRMAKIRRAAESIAVYTVLPYE